MALREAWRTLKPSIGGTIDVDAAQRTPAELQLATTSVANRNKGRRGRSRKRRRPVAPTADGGATAALPRAGEDRAREREPAPSARGSRARARPRVAPQRGGGARPFRDPQSVGERPMAPRHPLPLSELLILVGAIGTVVGLSKGVSHGGPSLIAGLAAVVIGTVEVTLREHLSGYRSHTLILALLPTIVFHSAVVLIAAAFTRTPPALNVALLGLDAAVFAFLFKLLRARFRDARRERVFKGRR
jgi:hypothetical protein